MYLYVGGERALLSAEAISIHDTPISPSTVVPIVQHVEVLDNASHDIPYYLSKFKKTLLHKNGRGYEVKYYVFSRCATISRGSNVILTLNCRSASSVKAQYLVFRLCEENIDRYNRHMSTVTEEDLSGYVQQITPPEDVSYSLAHYEQQRHRSRRRFCCIQ